MGEPQIITFEYDEMLKMLIKHQKIHEGFWTMTIQVAVNAGGIQIGPTEKDMVLGVVIPLLKFGIQKQDKLGPLTLDAKEVNPPSKP
ncbi:MAG: hypothetical protein ACLPT6_02175 [Desulfobaccales bacterium]